MILLLRVREKTKEFFPSTPRLRMIRMRRERFEDKDKEIRDRTEQIKRYQARIRKHQDKMYERARYLLEKECENATYFKREYNEEGEDLFFNGDLLDVELEGMSISDLEKHDIPLTSYYIVENFFLDDFTNTTERTPRFFSIFKIRKSRSRLEKKKEISMG